MELNIPALFPAKTRWDETEFNRLFLEYFPRICEIVFRIISDHDQAEDLASEAFWRLWSSPPLKPDNLPGWLYRVATHLAYNALRSSRRRLKYETSFTVDPPHQATSIEDVVSRKEQTERVRNVLRRMPLREVQLLVLRSSGLSYKEIATRSQSAAWIDRNPVEPC